MPPTNYIRVGDKIILKDGTFAYYGDNYIRKRDIHAVEHNGIWCLYQMNQPGFIWSVLSYMFR